MLNRSTTVCIKHLRGKETFKAIIARNIHTTSYADSEPSNLACLYVVAIERRDYHNEALLPLL